MNKTTKDTMLTTTQREHANTFLNHMHDAITRIGEMLPRKDIEVAILLKPNQPYRCAIRLGYANHWMKDTPLAHVLDMLAMTDQDRAEKAASAARLIEDFKTQVDLYEYMNAWKESEVREPTPF